MLTILGYILLGLLIIVYISVIFQLWEHKRNEKSEWQKYWDDVFEKNKNL